LATLSHSIFAGKPLKVAVDEMVGQTEREFRAKGFSDQLIIKPDLKSTQVQLWRTLKLLCITGRVKYDDLLFGVFSGNNEQLKNHIKNGIFTIKRDEEGLMWVFPFSRLYWTVFQKLIHSPTLSLSFDIMTKKAEIFKDQEELVTVEQELSLIQTLSSNVGLEKRKAVLSTKLVKLSQKLELKENELHDLEGKK